MYVYRSLVRCGSCGGQVTVKTSTNRYGKKYIHYYCWKKDTRHLYCPEGAVQESEIDRAVATFVDELTLPPTWVQSVLKRLDTLQSAALEAAATTRRRNDELLSRTTNRLERLRELLVDGTITADDYAKDKNKLTEEQARLQELLSAETHCDADLEPWRDGLLLVSEAKKLFLSATPEHKRALVKSVALNLVLKDKKVLIEAKKIFSVFREARGCPDERAFWDFLRTHITLNEGKTNDGNSI